MQQTTTFLFLAMAVLAIPAAAQKPLEPEQATLLEEARAAALTYSSSLPDFLCTELIRRQEDPTGNGRWRRVDSLTIRLSYFEHKEDYKLMAINNKPTDVDFLRVGGALSTGEFGSRLLALFHAESKAEFEWKGWAHAHGRRVAVFHYRIAKEHSSFQVQSGMRSILTAYRGEVVIDEETRRVLKLTAQGELPVGFPVRSSVSTVEYDFRKVGGTAFLLPVRAGSSMQQGNLKTQNDVEFNDYRKFHSESTLTFDTPVDKK